LRQPPMDHIMSFRVDAAQHSTLDQRVAHLTDGGGPSGFCKAKLVHGKSASAGIGQKLSIYVGNAVSSAGCLLAEQTVIDKPCFPSAT
jgi:hypothetical protein